MQKLFLIYEINFVKVFCTNVIIEIFNYLYKYYLRQNMIDQRPSMDYPNSKSTLCKISIIQAVKKIRNFSFYDHEILLTL